MSGGDCVEIRLYSTAAERNKLNKALSDPLILGGNLREQCSLLAPSIVVQGEKTIAAYNYAYIPDFNRYYFINSIESVRNDLWRLTLAVDVLMSYRNEISALSCVVESNTSPDTESYMNGEPWLSTVKESTSIINFPAGLNDTGEYILITSGG